jgi:hypothetical protein
MTTKEFWLALAARRVRSVKSFRRTEGCLLKSRHCLEKSYKIFDPKARIGEAVANGKATLS